MITYPCHVDSGDDPRPETEKLPWIEPALTPVGSNRSDCFADRRSGRKLYMVAHAEALRDGQNGLGSGIVSLEGVV